MSELSEELQAKISDARSLNDVPSTHSMLPYRNLGELLEEQVDYDEQGRKFFLSPDA